jgi:hypothetical protein
VYAKPYALQTGDIDFHQVNSVLTTVMKEAISLEMQNGDNYDFVTLGFDPARLSLQIESLAY